MCCSLSVSISNDSLGSPGPITRPKLSAAATTPAVIHAGAGIHFRRRDARVISFDGSSIAGRDRMATLADSTTASSKRQTSQTSR